MLFISLIILVKLFETCRVITSHSIIENEMKIDSQIIHTIRNLINKKILTTIYKIIIAKLGSEVIRRSNFQLDTYLIKISEFNLEINHSN